MSSRAIRAPVPGSVWTHATAVGQHVRAGAVLLVLEVMKTEFPIEAPVDGTVTYLRPCNETLEADAVVAMLEVA